MMKHEIIIRGSGGGGGKGGGGSQRAPVESPNTLQSASTARLVELLCEGPIYGLVDGHKSIFFDKTPWQNKDGSYNYGGIGFDMRYGYSGQDYMPGFSEVEAEFNVGAQVKYGNPITKSIEDPEIDAIRVTLSIPILMLTDVNSGDRLPTSVYFAIFISSKGGPFNWVVNTALSGKTTSTFEWSYRISLPPGGAPWQVRVHRQQPDDASDTVNTAFSFARYTRIIESKLRYPDTALVGLTVNAQKFGNNIPGRAYEIYGQMVPVPKNYDAWSRRYSGIWDGTFKESWTNNPAWIFHYALTDARSGLGRELRGVNVDKWGLYAIAQYCDEPVPDGRGGMEPRFTFNGVIPNLENAKNILSNIAGNFRGICYFAMGQVFCAQDRPLDPKRNLSNANVVGGKFVYEGSGYSTRHSVALVTYLDPDEGYEPEIEVVEDPEAVHEFGYRTLDVVAYGCTSRGQAWRQGMMALYAEKHLTRMVSFSTGLEGADLMPGDIINVMDAAHAGIRQAGRLAGAAGLSVVLDYPYNFEAGLEYQIEITMPDNTLFKTGVVNPGTAANQIDLTAPLPHQPIPGANWILYSSKLVPQLFRIMNVREGDNLTFEFAAVAYDPRKFDEVEKGIVLPDRPTSLLPTGPLEKPKNLTVEEYIYLKGGLSLMAGLSINWFTSDPRIIAYELEWKVPGASDYLSKVTVGGLGFDMDNDLQGLFSFRVRSVDALGRTSEWAYIDANIMGLYRPPLDVTGFRGQVSGDDLKLTWDHNPDILLDHYEIRYSPAVDGSATWAQAAVVAEYVSRGQTEKTVPLNAGTYFIKAVSIKNVHSANPAVITNDISAEFVRLNVVWETEQEKLPWTGFHDRTEIDHRQFERNLLTLTDMPYDAYSYEDLYALPDAYRVGMETEGYYYFDPYIHDLGGAYLCRVSGFLESFGLSFDFNAYAYPNLYDLEDAYGLVDAGRYVALIEYSFIQVDPLTPGNDDLYSYPNAYSLVNAYNPESILWSLWRPLVQPEDIMGRAFRFRIHLEALNEDIQPFVVSARVILDMPDRWDIRDDLEVEADPAGHWISFTPPFYHLSTIAAPMIQEGLEGDWYRVTEKSREGYRLFLYDKNGAPAARVIDLMAKGYGALQ